MCLRSRPRIFPSRSKAKQAPHAADGYALVIVMMLATLLLVSLTVALPNVYQQGQREREEELIFRGSQYARAIALFRRQFQRYPVDVKELLQTNGMRFLRKAYPDPMSPKGKWRFIHVSATGVLLDSKIQSIATGPAGGMGTPPGMTQGPFGGGAGPPGPSQSSSAFFGPSSEVKGAFIVGVASTSHRESIRIWNQRTHYDEWEFLGTDMNALGIPTGVPGQGAPAQPLGQPGFPNPPANPGLQFPPDMRSPEALPQ